MRRLDGECRHGMMIASPPEECGIPSERFPPEIPENNMPDQPGQGDFTMRRFSLNLFLSACCVAVLAATASAADTTKATPSSSARSSLSDSVTFTRGQSDLSATDQASVRALVGRAGQSGMNIKEIRVIAWSDSAAPTEEGHDLSADDRKLADARGAAIKDFLKKELRVSNVTVVNMAESSSAIARMLKTDQAELKSAFRRGSAAGVKSQELSDEIRAATEEGGPSKAVLFVAQEARNTPSNLSSPLVP